MSYGSDLASLKSIALKYGLTLTNVKPYASHYKKAAAYRAETKQGHYLIKPFYGRTKNTRLTSQEQVVKVSTYVRILQESAYPHMPKWLSTTSGRYWVAKMGRPYYMTEWIEGRKLQPEAQDYLNLGRALASLHVLNNHGLVAKSRVTTSLIHELKWRHQLFRRCLRLVEQDKREGYWFGLHGDQCIALGHESLAMLEQTSVMNILTKETKHPALIHGDVTFPNIIIQSDTLFLIDWDMVSIGSTYYEVAKTLANVTNFNPSLIQALLQGYEEINPLLPEERLLIRALFGFPREAWMTALALRSKRTTSLHLLKQTWDARLEAIRWLDQWANIAP